MPGPNRVAYLCEHPKPKDDRAGDPAQAVADVLGQIPFDYFPPAHIETVGVQWLAPRFDKGIVGYTPGIGD